MLSTGHYFTVLPFHRFAASLIFIWNPNLILVNIYSFLSMNITFYYVPYSQLLRFPAKNVLSFSADTFTMIHYSKYYNRRDFNVLMALSFDVLTTSKIRRCTNVGIGSRRDCNAVTTSQANILTTSDDITTSYLDGRHDFNVVTTSSFKVETAVVTTSNLVVDVISTS